MALPPGYRPILLDTVGGTVACGIVLTFVVVFLARYLSLGHL
jgi:hypothetical protein